MRTAPEGIVPCVYAVVRFMFVVCYAAFVFV